MLQNLSQTVENRGFLEVLGTIFRVMCMVYCFTSGRTNPNKRIHNMYSFSVGVIYLSVGKKESFKFSKKKLVDLTY